MSTCSDMRARQIRQALKLNNITASSPLGRATLGAIALAECDNRNPGGSCNRQRSSLIRQATRTPIFPPGSPAGQAAGFLANALCCTPPPPFRGGPNPPPPPPIPGPPVPTPGPVIPLPP